MTLRRVLTIGLLGNIFAQVQAIQPVVLVFVSLSVERTVAYVRWIVAYIRDVQDKFSSPSPEETKWRERALKLEHEIENLRAKYESEHISECGVGGQMGS